MAVSVTLLEKVLHEGRAREVGDVIEVEAEHAKSLIERGVAEAKKAVRRGKAGDGGDGD